MWADQATLSDIDTAARRIIDFTRGYTFEQFLEDEKTWSAVLHQIGVIGEAVKRLSEPLRAQHPTIPWAKMAAMRNVVIHAYESVDLERVWQTATVSVPALQAALAPLLSEGAEN
jgi:uncharacterized protein with HEPN domain